MRMTGLGRGAVLAAGLMLVAACDVAFAQKESETVDKTVAFPAGGTLKLRNFSGDVHITATKGHDVVIKAVREADRDRLDHINLDIQTSGSTVSIDANKRDSSWSVHEDNVVHTTFDIQVPASAMLDVDVFSSRLTIAGITGSQKLKTFSGVVAVTGAKGAVGAETFSGNVDIEARAAGASPSLDVQTFSGDISATLAADAAGPVSLNTFSGRLDSDIAMTIHSTGRNRNTRDKSGSSDKSSSGSSDGTPLKFHTFSGSVKIAK